MPRAILLDAQVTPQQSIPGTILAGCVCATSLMAVYLLNLLEKALQQHPVLGLVNVVDDIHLHAMGEPST
eukprot:561879-Amphidinium_carterae.1